MGENSRIDRGMFLQGMGGAAAARRTSPSAEIMRGCTGARTRCDPSIWARKWRSAFFETRSTATTSFSKASRSRNSMERRSPFSALGNEESLG